MSYQIGQTVNQYIPNYVLKSDYLPTRVVDGNTAQTSQLVSLILFSWDSMRKKREEAEFLPKDQLNSIQTDMHHSECPNMLELTTLSIMKVLVESPEDIDWSMTHIIWKFNITKKGQRLLNLHIMSLNVFFRTFLDILLLQLSRFLNNYLDKLFKVKIQLDKNDQLCFFSYQK